MLGLTLKQKNILNFIEEFSFKEGMSPTVYEIADNFQIKTSTVFAHVKALQKKNYLSRSSKARSLTLLNTNTHKPLHMSFGLSIPLLGRVNAGTPADNEEYVEGEVCVDPAVVGSTKVEDMFALKIQGESMRDIGMLEGDVIIVKKGVSARAGDIAVALVDNETTVKSYFPMNDGTVELRPANADFHTQTYPAENVDVQGVVVGLQRAY